jgi:hypothetical protein
MPKTLFIDARGIRHVSRAGELARQAGAVLRLPPQDRVRFAFTPIADGESIGLGQPSLIVPDVRSTRVCSSVVVNGAAAEFQQPG